MERAELGHRIALLELLWYGIGRNPPDEQLRALAIQTAKIPLPWLAEGVNELSGLWQPGFNVPTVRTIFDAARRVAGFRPIYTPEGYVDPTPSNLRWWPPAGFRVTHEHGERWNEPPEQIACEGLIPVQIAARASGMEPLREIAATVLQPEPEEG